MYIRLFEMERVGHLCSIKGIQKIKLGDDRQKRLVKLGFFLALSKD